MAHKIPAIIISDHHLFADLITPVLGRMGVLVVHHSGFVKPGLAFLESHSVELVFIDQVMPTAERLDEDDFYDRTGIATNYEIVLEAIAHIRKHYPVVKVIAVTEDREPARCARLIKAGAHGIVCKPCSLAECKSVIRRALYGISPAVPDALYQPLLDQLARPIPVLSQKDVQVLRFIQLGLTNKAIAQKVGVGLHTVRNRFVRICKKLGANGRIEAVTKATEYGFLDYYY